MFASARSCDLRAGRRRPAAIVTRCTGRGGSRVVHQEQRRSSYRSDVWLPRELPDEKRGAIHASDSGNAADFFSDAADLYWLRPSRSVESTGIRFRAAAIGGPEIECQWIRL